MRSSYARRALSAAAESVQRHWNYTCEPLEQRRLLTTGDPVIVLTEAFQPSEISAAAPYLWHNPSEDAWDLNDYASSPWSGHADGNDSNSLADDYYGWNFDDGTPNVINPTSVHGTNVLQSAVQGIQDGALVDSDLPNHVKVMFVFGTAEQTVNYIVDKKLNDGINIIGISFSIQDGSPFTAAEATTLRDNDILFFCPGSGRDSNRDHDAVQDLGDALLAFYRATPRLAVQEAPLGNVITVTTDPGDGPSTDFGVNSFYFAAPGVTAPSYAVSKADAYAGVAVAAYQQAHSGQTPDWQTIKRAMMSGVDYTDDLVLTGQRASDTLADRTITHNWDPITDMRTSGGLLDIIKIASSINQTTPEVSGVSMTGQDPLGTNVTFDLHHLGELPSNWTINWGDNTDSEVLPGASLTKSHP